MSVWEENFGRKTEGKGAGSRSAWRFDLLWRIVCEIVCCASVPQPHLKKNSPAATGNKYQVSSETMLPIVLRLLSSRVPTRIKTVNSLQDFHNTGHSILTHLPQLSTITNLSHWSINLLVTHLPVSVGPVCDRRPDQHQTSHGSPTLVTVRYPGGASQHSSGLTSAYTTPLICLCQSHGITGCLCGWFGWVWMNVHIWFVYWDAAAEVSHRVLQGSFFNLPSLRSCINMGKSHMEH